MGRHLGISLNIAVYAGDPSGGIEYHYREPPEHMQDEAPSHDHCWLLKAPCWHDGSSTLVTDFWIPRWLEAPNDHVRMFKLMEEAITARQITTLDIIHKARGSERWI